jgi:three-Cys-motif partner protein
VVKKGTLKFDEIGYWSEIKIEIVRKYAVAYSVILAAQPRKGIRLRHVYIDGFSGAGEHISKTTGEIVPGTPQAVLSISPPFTEYHFIDLEETKTDHLKSLVGERPDVHIHTGDCNDILTKDIFPNVRYEQFKRGLCLLDPYGLHLDWEVIRMAAGTNAIDMFLNFPVADMNRNVFWRNPVGVSLDDIERMNTFWGDTSWNTVAYTKIKTLFGDDIEKVDNRTIAMAFRERLRSVAGFRYVPEPIPMRNSRNAEVYYLFFASQKEAGENIAKAIFRKYREYRAR